MEQAKDVKIKEKDRLETHFIVNKALVKGILHNKEPSRDIPKQGLFTKNITDCYIVSRWKKKSWILFVGPSVA